MSDAYLPILLIFGVSVLNAVFMVALSHILNPRRPTPQKAMPYESGMIPLGDTRARFSVKFYLVAISFIVFDLEAVFLIPWAVEMRALGWSGFVAASIFVAVLTAGLVYEWKKGRPGLGLSGYARPSAFPWPLRRRAAMFGAANANLSDHTPRFRRQLGPAQLPLAHALRDRLLRH